MKAYVKTKEEIGNNTEIKAVLKDESIRGCVMAVTSLSQEPEVFKITLKPTTKRETANLLCEKLKATGCHAKVIWSRGATSGVKARGLRYRTTDVHRVGDRRANSFVIAKVNAPNIPTNPPGLPEPEGKKTKKHK